MNSTYLLLKTLHVIGAVIFLRNIIVTGWWKFMDGVGLGFGGIATILPLINLYWMVYKPL